MASREPSSMTMTSESRRCCASMLSVSGRWSAWLQAGIRMLISGLVVRATPSGGGRCPVGGQAFDGAPGQVRHGLALVGMVEVMLQQLAQLAGIAPAYRAVTGWKQGVQFRRGIGQGSCRRLARR